MRGRIYLKNKVMLVDGMALLFRGFFATSFRGNFMKNIDGIPTNGVYQFLKYFLDAIDTFEPTHVIVCWDMGSKTFRTETYEHYKANRDAPPEELIPQFDLAKEIVDLFEIPNVGLKNFEADDCIGTLAKLYKTDSEVIVLTGDKDILQLVDDNIHVAIMKKGMGNYDLHTIDNFYEKTELEPKQIIDLKGLMGDPSDNYPGVRGIGEKTALKLLKEFHSIEQILENKDKLTKGIKTKIEEDLAMLYLSQELAEIKCDVEISCNLEDALWTYQPEQINKKLIELKFDSMAKLFAQ